MSDKLKELTERRSVIEKELSEVMADIKKEKAATSTPSKAMRDTIRRQAAANNELRDEIRGLKNLCATLLGADGFTYKGIAEVMGVTAKTAEMYVYKASSDIRKIEFDNTHKT